MGGFFRWHLILNQTLADGKQSFIEKYLKSISTHHSTITAKGWGGGGVGGVGGEGGCGGQYPPTMLTRWLLQSCLIQWPIATDPLLAGYICKAQELAEPTFVCGPFPTGLKLELTLVRSLYNIHNSTQRPDNSHCSHYWRNAFFFILEAYSGNNLLYLWFFSSFHRHTNTTGKLTHYRKCALSSLPLPSSFPSSSSFFSFPASPSLVFDKNYPFSSLSTERNPLVCEGHRREDDSHPTPSSADRRRVALA